MYREVNLDEEKAITCGGETDECDPGVAEELAHADFALTAAGSMVTLARNAELNEAFFLNKSSAPCTQV